jgi:HEAT repeat protein
MKKDLSSKRIILLAIVLGILSSPDNLSAQSPELKDGQTTAAAARVKQIRKLVDSKDPEAATKLVAALASPDWYVRGEAARALGRLGNRSHAQDLLPLVQDGNWFVRDAALSALSEIGETSAAESLKKSLETGDPFARARAARSLGLLKDATATDSLIKALVDEHENVRRAAASALGEVKATAAVDALIKLLEDADPSVRKESAAALGKIGERRAADAILAANKDAGAMELDYAIAAYRLGKADYLDRVTLALQSEFADERTTALRALLEFADPRSLTEIMDLAKNGAVVRDGNKAAKNSDEAITIRLAVAEALPRFNGPSAIDALMLLGDDAEPVVRATAVRSLGKAVKGDQKAVGDKPLSFLVGLLKKEKSPLVLSALNQAIAVFDQNAVADALLGAQEPGTTMSANIAGALVAADVTVDNQIKQLSGPSTADRLRAAERLRRLGDQKAVPALIDALATDKDLLVKVKVVEALGSLKDRRAVEALINAAVVPEKEVRAAAITSLGLIGDAVATETLFAAAQDGEPIVRNAAIQSLSLLGVSVERLATDVAHPNWQVRAAALSTYARLGDARAVPVIMGALKDSDMRVRAEAARTLGQFNDARATDALIASLNDQSSEVRIQATFALGRMKEARALAPLSTLLNDRDQRVSLAAAESLARMKDPRATRLLVTSLSDADWRVRTRAAKTLARASAEGEIVDIAAPLVAALKDKDPVVRFYASTALVALGPEAIPPLVDLLRAEREADRERGVRVLTKIGAPAVEQMIALLLDRKAPNDARAAAARTLGIIGDARAITPLSATLRDENSFLKQQAAIALGVIGEPAIDQLMNMSSAAVPATREIAIEALGNIHSERSLNRVIEALTDQNPGVRSSAVKALGASSSERAVPHLMALMRNETGALRSQAAASLARLGAIALPQLISTLKDSQPSIRALAAESLGEIGSKEAVAPLIDLIKTDSSGARGEAIAALGRIGDQAAIEPILGLMRGGSVTVRKKSVAALTRFRDPRIVDALVGALSDQSEEVRELAAAGLGEAGDARALASLERAADRDESPDVRAAAARAISQVRALNQNQGEKPVQQKATRP